MNREPDALQRLIERERDDEIPPPGTEDQGWTRLVAALGAPATAGDGEPPSMTGPQTARDALHSAGSAGTSASSIVKLVFVAAGVTGVGAAAFALHSPRDPEAKTQALASPPAVTSTHELPAAPVPSTGLTSAPSKSMDAQEQVPVPHEQEHELNDRATATDAGTDPAAERPRRTPRTRREHRPPRSEAHRRGLADEVELLARAQRELNAGRLEAALRSLERHAHEHPDGRLAQEREAVRTIVQCRREPEHAERWLQAFTSAWPRSTHLVRLREACQPNKDQP